MLAGREEGDLIAEPAGWPPWKGCVGRAAQLEAIAMLAPMIQHQRKNALREEQADYNISVFTLEADVPLP